MSNFQRGEAFAIEQDRNDSLAGFREQFSLIEHQGKTGTYLVGNSIGLQPKKSPQYVSELLDGWRRRGIADHHKGTIPWIEANSGCNRMMAKIVGAQENETALMNGLSVNLHLMLTSFYRPTSERYKILIESRAFPSDQYAVASQAKLHGHRDAIVEWKPRHGEWEHRLEDFEELLTQEPIALALIGNVNYVTGQAYPIGELTRLAHQKDVAIGFDLAHGVGNLLLNLHDDGPDFAVWCGYKYLNGGPGCIGGAFVHERHHGKDLPRLEGWWGNHPDTLFELRPEFDPAPGAAAWQVSNPASMQMASLRASLEIFDQISMKDLSEKRSRLNAYMEFLLADTPAEIITPRSRGTHLALKMPRAKQLVEKLADRGVFCDLRNPDVIRVAPVPLYTRFQDVYRFVEETRKILEEKE